MQPSITERRWAAFIFDWLLWSALISFVNGELGVRDWLMAGRSTMHATLNAIAEISLWRILFLAKDGFRGRSPGKAVFGLRVVETASGLPIGFVKSVQRNLLLAVPFMGELVVCFAADSGRRPLDHWAGTIVEDAARFASDGRTGVDGR